MSKDKYLVTVIVAPAGALNEAHPDDPLMTGREPVSLFLPLVRLFHAAHGETLAAARNRVISEGLRNKSDRAVIRLICSAEALGRVSVLHFESADRLAAWSRNPNAGGKPPIMITIAQIQQISGGCYVVG